MRPQLETFAEILPEKTVDETLSLVRECSRQVQEVIASIGDAIARLEIDGRAHTRILLLDAANQFRRVKPLIDEIDELTFRDQTGFVAEQGRMLREGLAAADAEFKRAAIAFATTRAP